MAKWLKCFLILQIVSSFFEVGNSSYGNSIISLGSDISDSVESNELRIQLRGDADDLQLPGFTPSTPSLYIYDGFEHEYNATTFINSDGLSMIPLRLLLEVAGYEDDIKWNKADMTVIAGDGADKVLFKVGSKEFELGNTTKILPTAVSFIENSVYVPLRASAEVLGIDISYSDADNRIYLGGKKSTNNLAEWGLIKYHKLPSKVIVEGMELEVKSFKIYSSDSDRGRVYFFGLSREELTDFKNVILVERTISNVGEVEISSAKGYSWSLLTSKKSEDGEVVLSQIPSRISDPWILQRGESLDGFDIYLVGDLSFDELSIGATSGDFVQYTVINKIGAKKQED